MAGTVSPSNESWTCLRVIEKEITPELEGI